MLDILEDVDVDTKTGDAKITLLFEDKKIDITRLKLFLTSNVINTEESIRIEPIGWNGRFHAIHSDVAEIYDAITESSAASAALLVERLNGEGSFMLEGVRIVKNSNQTFVFSSKRRVLIDKQVTNCNQLKVSQHEKL